MKKSLIHLEEIRLVGITARTNNSQELTPEMGKIGPTIMRYFQEQLMNEIPHRITPGVTYCIYTDYESDETGEYTYFIGERVSHFEDTPPLFHELIIPPQNYAKFTVGPGVMPQVCIDAWQAIWKMDEKDLGSKRNFIADFEVYDERALDKNNTSLDILIGKN